ncbi:unnamed protein product [Cuscuta europaea]|uniref:HAT C-terminal dimerisation domain-containing protein n=1 Tax=Cuscuta europaea TaxID=41803 RepID=A0A9P0ZIA1_CUSEU|nr:unnamed protein product [Cuscuta europaea]
MENQDAIIRYNFDKQKDPKTGMWYAICKWCEKKCSMGVSGGFGMAIKHMKSCDKAKESGVGDDFDVLKWWKENERTFPILSKIAKQVLAMPISTVGVEQEFSAVGNVITDYRMRLSSSSLETLVCFHDWLKVQRRTQEITNTPTRHFMEETTEGGDSD